MNKPATFSVFLRSLGFVCLFLAMMIAAVYVVAADDAYYYECQRRADILPSSGISDEALKDLDARLSRYLCRHDEAALCPDSVLQLDVFGVRQPAFNEREMTHLLDCAELFDTASACLCLFCAAAVLLIVLSGRPRPRDSACAAAFAVFMLACRMLRLERLAAASALAAMFLALRGQTGRARPAWFALTLVLLPFTVFAVWACLDFDAAFTFFHRRLFSNDLWLLDPRTDLLIRICPESMFMSMGLRIALTSAGALVGIPLLLTLWDTLQQRQITFHAGGTSQ
ncbi:MAG: DUF1461 domain-containing protein [Clostridiales bacterium]|nr:DUF1461 domain-containing protein [Clostridiales bacterium]